MSTTTKAVAELHSQTSAALILGQHRATVRSVVPALGIKYKRDPGRAGLMLTREDVLKLASFLKVKPNWTQVVSR